MKVLPILGLLVLVLSFNAQASDYANAQSASQAGALSHSGAGAIGLIDSSTTNVEADDGSKRVAGVFAAGVTAGGSNPCVVSVGGGVGLSGFGINFANAYNDGECNVRESLRLMAAISMSDQPSNQIMMREIACQSLTYWDAMERTYMETEDDRYYCSNERPNDAEKSLSFRRPSILPVASNKPRNDGLSAGDKLAVELNESGDPAWWDEI